MAENDKKAPAAPQAPQAQKAPAAKATHTIIGADDKGKRVVFKKGDTVKGLSAATMTKLREVGSLV